MNWNFGCFVYSMKDLEEAVRLKRNNRVQMARLVVGFLLVGFTVMILLVGKNGHSASLSGTPLKPDPPPTPPLVSTHSIPAVTAHPSSVSPEPTAAEQTSQPQEVTPPAVAYQGSVEHIFFHPLIAYPELAFDGDAMAKGYNDWFVTVKEFNKILESLYANQYILIDIHDLYEEKEVDNKMTVISKVLSLPPGKKPLILSIDDLNYYTYMRENGNVFRLVLDSQGEVATYSVTPKGEERISRDNEIVPLLDDFVKLHPDFSWQGAKGVIALTGYQGILGYRTDQIDSPDYAKVKESALSVIKRLKESGWSFASHGYGHLDAAKVTYERFSQDTLRWKKEVEPLTGPTSVYIYPYGSKVLPGNPKYSFLLESGFRMICSVGPAPYLKARTDSIMMDRRHIDGIALEEQRTKLLPLFDSRDVLDDSRFSRK
jgi:hypothetical protein